MSDAPPSGELCAVDSLIDVVIANYPIDSSRVYISGYSRGCMASWYLLNKTPERFAGAVLAYGAGDPDIVSKFASVPIWCFCGDKDNYVYYNAFKAIFDAYEAVGGQGRFTTCRTATTAHRLLGLIASRDSSNGCFHRNDKK